MATMNRNSNIVMKYFSPLPNFPIHDDMLEVLEFYMKGLSIEFPTDKRYQIPMVSTKPNVSLKDYVSSFFDISSKTSYNTENNRNAINNHKYILKEFKGSVFEEVYDFCKKKYSHVGRMRILNMPYGTCYSWHIDSHNKVHYPLKTSFGNFMLIEDEKFHIPLNTWYETNTQNWHTAFNANPNKENRIHLVIEVL